MAGGFARLNTSVRFGAGDEDICFVRLAGLSEEASFEKLLTPPERSHAATIGSPLQRARFVVSRGLRREMFSSCSGIPAADLQFTADGEGKPRVSNADGWDFNLSHAGDYVAVVVGRGRVGIDLEQHREVREMSSIVERYFHPDEARAWRQAEESQRAEAFFLFWSAREAAMKCAGLGLAKGLSLTRVAPEFLVRRESEATVGDMPLRIKELDAPAGYTLVVCRGA